MKTIKAIFFDRDNTITYFNPEKRVFLTEFIHMRTGREYKLSYDEMMALFDLAGYPKEGLKSVSEEILFWKRYYIQLLMSYGVEANLEEDSQVLFNELWCNNDRVLFSETEAVLKYFKNEGLKVGVISDTSPSLRLTLEQLGLDKYIDSYICSDLIGFMKPDPRIFRAALESLGVTAEESIYVDDYDIEAEGARKMGFTSFHIVRSDSLAGEWTINSLEEIVQYYKTLK